jgi:hypothetical protein
METSSHTRHIAIASLIATFGGGFLWAVPAAQSSWPATAGAPAQSAQSSPDLCHQLDECQGVFDSESRDEPWSSRMEEQLRIYVAANAAFPVYDVRCGRTLCRISCDVIGRSFYAWSRTMAAIKNQPWYTHFMREVGTSTTSWPREGLMEESPGQWIPKPTFVLKTRWFLVRDPAAASDDGTSLPAAQAVVNPIRLDTPHAALIAQSQTLIGFHHAFELEQRDSAWADVREHDIQEYLQQRAGSGPSNAGSPGADRSFTVEHVECRSMHCEIQLTGYDGDVMVDLLRQQWASDLRLTNSARASVREERSIADLYIVTRRR